MLRSAIVAMAVLGLLALSGGVLGAVQAPAGDPDAPGVTTAVARDGSATSRSDAPTDTAVRSTEATSSSARGSSASASPSGVRASALPAAGEWAPLRACIDEAGRAGSQPLVDGPPQRQMRDIVALVEDVRGLQFDTAPDLELVDGSAFAQRATAEFDDTYPDARAAQDARVLVALGAAPDTFVPKRAYAAGLQRATARYRRGDDTVAVRVSDGSEVATPRWQTAVAHQVHHALVDQRLPMPVGVHGGPVDGDVAQAASAVVEGDASLTERAIERLVRPTAAAPAGDRLAAAGVQVEGQPWFVAQRATMPFTDGAAFVCARFRDGGQAAVDALYRDMPRSTAAIMDPRREDTEPVDPRDPGTPGDGWRARRDVTIGAAELSWLFEAPGNDRTRALDDARATALEWTGGQLALWVRGDRPAVGVALTQRRADGPLCDAVRTWYERAFPDSRSPDGYGAAHAAFDGDDQDAVLMCDGRDVRLGIAPDLRTARALAR